MSWLRRPVPAARRSCFAGSSEKDGMTSGTTPKNSSEKRVRVNRAAPFLSRFGLLSRRIGVDAGDVYKRQVTTNLAEVRARYRAVALALRNIYCEQFPWLQAAQLAGVKVRYADVAVIADPEHIGDERVLLDSRDMARSDRCV